MRKVTFGILLALAASASAATIKIYPYDGARFLPGQRFDVRVEVSGLAAGETANVTVNGQPLSGLTQTSSAAGNAEYTLRNYSVPAGGQTLRVSTSGGSSAAAAWNTQTFGPAVQPAKKVILFVGDGMGWNTVTAARIIAKGYNPNTGVPGGYLEMESGLGGLASITTSSYDSFLADSANTASSIATGQKILVNALNVYPDNTEGNSLDNPRVEPITGILKRTRGMGVGVVSSAFGTDATPAAFAAFTRRRGDYQAIADQYFDGTVQPDVMLFGGSNDFIPSTAAGSRRKDARDLIKESQTKGFSFVENRTQLGAVNANKLFGLFNLSNIPSYLDRAQYKRPEMLGSFTDMPYLWEMTQKAVETLDKNQNGFFLMVEAGMIDKYEHPLDWQRGIWDVLELDKAVAWAKQYAARNPDTLVLVTADHNHSLSTYAGYDYSKTGRDGVRVYEQAGFPTYTGRLDANGIPFPQTARGVAVGFAGTPDYCETWGSGPVFLDPTVSDGKGGFVPNPAICSQPGAVARTGNLGRGDAQGVHSADPVPLFAFGAGSSLFNGVHDQTDIFFLISQAMGLNPGANR